MSNNNYEKRYTCMLSPSVVEKACVELREPISNKERLAEIDKLRDAFLRSERGAELIRSDDMFFLKFLRAKKFNQAKALAMLINYHKQRACWPDLFDKVTNPTIVQSLLNADCVGTLPLPAKDGSTVIVGWPGKQEGMFAIDLLACVVLTIEKLLENEEIQVHGVTVVDNLTYYNLAFAKQMTPNLGKRFVALIQDAMPLRLKSINIVNEPKIFDVLLTLLRPFIKQKIKKRLHIHGNNYTGLRKIINIDALPKKLAVNGSSMENWALDILTSGCTQ